MSLSFRLPAIVSMGLALAAVPVVLCVEAQDTPHVIEFSPERWDLENARVVDHLGRKALIGTAYLKGVEFGDGVIECDVAVKAGVRSYPGILFRLQSAEEYERIYLRPHRSPFYDDAVQYLACFHGLDSWQLYNGPGNTSAAVIPVGRWFHLKVEMLGTQARLFLDGAPQPVLSVWNLRRGNSRGGLGLTTTADETAFFSNFSFRPDTSLRFPPAPALHTPPGIVGDWEISEPFKKRQLDSCSYPDGKTMQAARWTKVTAQPDGILDISRSYGRSGNEPEAVLARTSLHADVDGPKTFHLGYSDEAALFLNGQAVYCGNSTYRSRDTSFLGVLGPFDSVSLPLRRGENEVLFVISETSGGWGLMLQDATALGAAPGVTELWHSGRDFLIPESAAYDPESDAFYVSNFDAYNPSRGEGGQSISKLASDGRVVSLNWVSNLFNPTGLAVRKGRLYAVERSGIAEIDIALAKLVRRMAAPGAALLNDIAVAESGDIYVSDSRGNCIYRFTGEKVEQWFKGPEISAPNGVLADAGRLVVGTNGDGCLKSVDLATKTVKVLAALGPGLIDGMALDMEGGILVSHNEGRLLRVTPDGRVVRLLDTTARRINIADFCYDPGRNMVVIPTFVGGSVMAYRLGRFAK